MCIFMLFVCVTLRYGRVFICIVFFFFFFKQKTAYEMRISDWSSDVCSSDLVERYAQKNVCRPLIELATQLLVRDEELEQAVARRQGHLVDLDRKSVV